jgi:hypothetical protein
MRKAFLYFLVLLLLASCSPQKRLHRLVTKHPELNRIDTIKVQDTVFVPRLSIDTLFSSSILVDTTTITQDKLQIKLIEINDTIYLDAKVEPDTIILNKEILVERIIDTDTEPEKWWLQYWWLIIILGFQSFVLLFTNRR